MELATCSHRRDSGREKRTKHMPPCQGEGLLNALCHGDAYPDDTCYSEARPDGVCHGICHLDPARILWIQSVKANVRIMGVRT